MDIESLGWRQTERGVVYVGNPMTFILQTFLFLLIKYFFVKL